MDLNGAIAQIRVIFSHYAKIASSDPVLRQKTRGKLYELFCLANVLDELAQTYGYGIRFVGQSIDFQSSPGPIPQNRSYFQILDTSGNCVWDLFTDVEFCTLGSLIPGQNAMQPDRSACHEIDLVVVEAGVRGRPAFDQIALGIECKSHANFRKSILKEVLGIRRELALLRYPTTSKLAAAAPSNISVSVPAGPASEYWFAYIDGKGNQYSASPSKFGVAFKHWEP